MPRESAAGNARVLRHWPISVILPGNGVYIRYTSTVLRDDGPRIGVPWAG